MGATRDDFLKFPRTPHLAGSTGTVDDRHLDADATAALLEDPSLIVEEKLDGTNVGIHFTSQGRMVLQCRGHEITEGMHPQYDLFKQWSAARRPVLEAILGDGMILFGEWLHARHSIWYRRLPHFFIALDLYDKRRSLFLARGPRLDILAPTGFFSAPVVHAGAIRRSDVPGLLAPSSFGAEFVHPAHGHVDSLMEGLYFRTETADRLKDRAKYVRPEFTDRVAASGHWQYRAMVANELAPGVDLWS